MINRAKEKLHKNFTIIPNEVFNGNLSPKAIGIFAYLLSKPESWKFNEIEIQKHFKAGKDLIKSGLKELEKNKMLLRKKIRDKKGKFIKTEYILYPNDEDFKESNSSLPDVGKSDDGESDTINTEYINTEYINNTSPKKQTSTVKKADKEKNTEENKTEEKKTDSLPNSFSFNLKKLTTYNELSEEYKAKLIGKCLLADGDLERFQNFVKALQEKDYKYKDFYRAYLKWDREKKYKNFKPKKIEGDWYEVCQINGERIAVNKKTLEIRKYKVE